MVFTQCTTPILYKSDTVVWPLRGLRKVEVEWQKKVVLMKAMFIAQNAVP